MFVPYKTDVILTSNPISNFVIIILTTWMFFISITMKTLFYSMVLVDWDVSGLLGHIFLHADFFHLAGNMFMLWIFGNAICSRMGNLAYLFFYLIVGLLGGMSHLLFDGNPAIGASGAVNGVIGAFLVLYPKNKVSVIVYAPYIFAFKAKIPSIIIICIWFIIDVLGVIFKFKNIAYLAHIGGLISGILLTFLALKTGYISYEILGKEIPEINKLKYNIYNSEKSYIDRRKKQEYRKIIHRCQYCGKLLRTSQSMVGKVVKCPSCSTMFTLE